MHVHIQALVEVLLTIEVSMKNLPLSMVAPKTNVLIQCSLTRLTWFLVLIGKFLQSRVTSITGKAVDDIIALTWWLKKRDQFTMFCEAGVLGTETLSKETIGDSSRLMLGVDR